MKSKELKRREAIKRLKNSMWENSKAKRLGTKTQEQWEECKQIKLLEGAS